MAFRIGQKVRLTNDANENYDNKFPETYKVAQWYNHYVPASKMESDEHGHPGYDESANGKLYHLTTLKGEDLHNDFYWWELESAR